jgi:hypothetical protein
MSKRFVVTIWLSSLLVGLFVAVPTTLDFIDHWRAKNYAEQGCKKYWSDGPDSRENTNAQVEAMWSEAARLDPEYLLLASASKTLSVGRDTARIFGYEQQWLDGLHVIQGFCDFVMNPQVSKN